MTSARFNSKRIGWPILLSVAILSFLTLMWLIPPRASAEEDEAAWMYNPNQVVDIYLELSPEAIEGLEKEPEEDQKVSFELKVNGVLKGPRIEKARIHLKGTVGASFRPLGQKAGFKLKFKKGTPDNYFGLKKMTLNNMVQDPSMIHETLAYEVFRAFGIPASRTGYANVYLKEEGATNWINYGVHLNIEALDQEVSMTRMFGANNTQHLYEADKPGTDLRPGQAGTFEVQVESLAEEEAEEPMISDLETLINAVNDHSGNWSENVSKVANLGEVTQMWGVERYVGHWDGYAGRAWNDTYRPNNYYLHSTPSGLFTMIPWGTDQTWGISPILFPQSPAYLGVHLAFDEEAGGRMFNYCYADASCKAQYIQALEKIYNGVGGLNLDAHAAALAQMLAPYQAEEEAGPRREYTAAQIAQGVAETRKYIGERPGELAAFLFPPATPTPPAPAPPQRHAKIGHTHVHGAVVITPLTAYGPGRAVQNVTAKFSRRRVKVCTGTRTVHRARKLTVRCRLPRRVQHLRRSHGLRLRVRVGFVGSGKVSTFRVRKLTLKPQTRQRRHVHHTRRR